MDKPVIAITGAGPTGFIGSSLMQYLRGNGFTVIALNRHVTAENENAEHRFFDLEQDPSPALLKNVQVLIHCAFISAGQHADAEHLNFQGTKKLIEYARRNGVVKIIFFSSVSAHDKAQSAYGRSKFRSEELFDLKKDAILKCSMVIGNGGIFERLRKYIQSKKIVPLMNGGKQPLQVIALADVQKVVLTIISGNQSGSFILANRQQCNYKEFFKVIARHENRSPVFLSFPLSLLKILVGTATFFGIKLPVNKENLLGLAALRYFDPESSLQQLQLNPLSMEEALIDTDA